MNNTSIVQPVEPTTAVEPSVSLKKLPPPPLKLFISYKSKDAQAALEIKSKLEALSAQHMQVFVSCSPDSLPPAENWRRRIMKELRDADCLLFLYTDAKETWDWCFYETGFYDGSRTENALLYILHAKGVPPPKPLEDLQAVEITENTETSGKLPSLGLDGLLDILFCQSTEPPINQDYKAASDIYNLLKSAICKPFLRPANLPPPKSFLRRLRLTITASSIDQFRTKAEIPPTALAYGDADSLALFKRVEKDEGWLWSELEADLKEHAIQEESSVLWIQSLATAMQDALCSRQVASGLPLFFCPFNLRTYRPSLSRLEYSDDGNAEFEIVFVDLPSELEAYPQEALGKTAHLINLARMFRWGALLPYRNEFDDRTKPNELLRIGNCILQAINNVTAESLNRGIRRQFDVLSAFKSEEQREIVKRALEKWPACFEKLQSSVSAKDSKQMKDTLEEMLAMNRSVLKVSSARFAELVEEMTKAEAAAE